MIFFRIGSFPGSSYHRIIVLGHRSFLGICLAGSLSLVHLLSVPDFYMARADYKNIKYLNEKELAEQLPTMNSDQIFQITSNQWKKFKSSAVGDYAPYIKFMNSSSIISFLPELSHSQIKLAILEGSLKYVDLKEDIQKRTFTKNLSFDDMKTLAERKKFWSTLVSDISLDQWRDFKNKKGNYHIFIQDMSRDTLKGLVLDLTGSDLKKAVVHGALKYSDIPKNHESFLNRKFFQILTSAELKILFNPEKFDSDLVANLSPEKWRNFKADRQDYSDYIQYMSPYAVKGLLSSSDLISPQIKTAIMSGKLEYLDLSAQQRTDLLKDLNGFDLKTLSDAGAISSNFAFNISSQKWRNFKAAKGDYSHYIEYMSSNTLKGLFLSSDLKDSEIKTAVMNRKIQYGELFRKQRTAFLENLTGFELTMLSNGGKLRLSNYLAKDLSLNQWREFQEVGGDVYSYKTYMSKDIFAGLILLDSSGFVQVSLPSIILEDTDNVRSVLSSRFSGGVSSKDKKSGLSVWTSGVLKDGEFSNGSSISLSRKMWDGFGGVDLNLNGFVLGSLAGYGNSFVEGKNDSSRAEMKNLHIGGYSGINFDRLWVYGGYTVLWSDVESNRRVDTVDLSSAYRIRTDQIFGEFGYRISFFEPFINFASVNLQQDSYKESSLKEINRSEYNFDGSERHVDAQFLTFGFRAKKDLGERFFNSSIYSMLGFRKSLGKIDEYGRREFTLPSGVRNSFIVPGLPVSENVALFGGGFRVNLNRVFNLDGSYTGQFDGGHINNTVQIQVKAKF